MKRQFISAKPRLITRVVMLFFVLTLCQSAAAQGSATDNWRIGAHGGTAGLGLNAGWDFHKNLGLRIIGNRFSYDYEDDLSDSEFEGDLELESYGLALDWYPFDNGFRLSGGAFLNKNVLSARAEGDLEFDGEDYADSVLHADMEFDSFAPYIGIGYDGGRGDKGLSFYTELGAYYQSEPKLTGRGSVGNDCTFSISDSSQASQSDCTAGGDLDGITVDNFLVDLQQEHRDLIDDLDDFKWYPVLAVGIVYRF